MHQPKLTALRSVVCGVRKFGMFGVANTIVLAFMPEWPSQAEQAANSMLLCCCLAADWLILLLL